VYSDTLCCLTDLSGNSEPDHKRIASFSLVLLIAKNVGKLLISSGEVYCGEKGHDMKKTAIKAVFSKHI